MADDDILIPTDGSPQADRAVDYGIELAERTDETVHGLYVVDERRYGETPALSSYELFFEKFEEEGAKVLDEFESEAAEHDLDATTSVTRGIPHEEIIGYASEADVDCIVMGRTGGGSAELPHLGSVTDRVLRSADVPVVTV